MAKTIAQKIEDKRAELLQAENQLKMLMKQEKEQERKARTNRLCERGGFMESGLPDLKLLTNDGFKSFFEMTMASKEGREFLAIVIADQEKKAATDGGNTTKANSDKSGSGAA